MLTHYPPGMKKGLNRHTDYGFLGLVKSNIPGLEVEDRITKKWVEATPMDDYFVVNIGDMLELWTKGYYKATPHRVRGNLPSDRLSLGFFLDPGFNTLIDSNNIPIKI